MKIKWKTLIISVGLALLAGVLGGLVSMDGMRIFGTLNKPPLSPPAWVFPVVWTVLYIMMGIAAYLVFVSGAGKKIISPALKLYAVQLVFNFMWTVIFFNFGQYYLAFVWLVALWILITATTVLFFRASRPAGYLMLPYLAWVTFAGYLNLSIAMLN